MKRNTDIFGSLVKMKGVLVFCTLILSSVEINEVSVIQALSSNIGEMVLDCQKEMEFTNDVIQDLLDFWNEQNQLTSTDLGCALVCVFEKNEFLNEEGNSVLNDNVAAFYKASGADDIMASRMVELLQLCKKSTRSIKSMCDNALEIAKCFRYGIFSMKWAPHRLYWKNTRVPPDVEPVQVTDESGGQQQPRREMSKGKVFDQLFKTCPTK